MKFILLAQHVDKNLNHFFVLDRNFLDPPSTSTGEAFGPKRFKSIVKECWFVSDNLNTSYTDVVDLSFQERVYLTELINDKLKETKKALDEIDKQANLKKQK